MQTFKNKVIVINGGSGRLGKILATHFMQYDCFLVLIGRDKKKLDNVCTNLKGKAKITSFVCDLTNALLVKQTILTINSKHKKIDILINSVGSWFQGEISDHTSEITRELFDSNVLGVINFTTQALNLVQKSPSAQILNIISTFTLEGHINWPIYLSSKEALKSFTQSLKHTLKSEQIKVMAICPDAINSHNIESVASIIVFMLEQPETIYISHLETQNNYSANK